MKSKNKNNFLAVVFLLFFTNYYAQSFKRLGSNNASDASANFLNLKVDANKTPYVAYSDGSRDKRTTVRKFNGTSWDFVVFLGLLERIQITKV